MHSEQIQIPIPAIQYIGELSLELYFAKRRIIELEAQVKELQHEPSARTLVT